MINEAPTPQPWAGPVLEFPAVTALRVTVRVGVGVDSATAVSVL